MKKALIDVVVFAEVADKVNRNCRSNYVHKKNECKRTVVHINTLSS